MVFQNNVLSGAGGSGTAVYTIDQSIRFNDDDNPYLSRTLSTASDGGKTYTFSWWQKLGSKIGATSVSNQYIIHTDLGGGSLADFLYIYDDKFLFWQQPTGTMLRTNQVFRDTAGWYNITFAYDSTQAIASERIRLYLNGNRITSFSTENYPSLNNTSYFNTNTTHYIGGANNSGLRFDGYLAEIHFLDGYAYDPSYFGLFNDSGIWIPKEYSGSYGTNGFYLKGESASDLGNDSSGNNNDFTTSGLASHDQVSDSPTNNFCVANPLIPSTVTYSEGNLKSVISANESTSATMGASSGKWYFEVYVNTVGSAYLGICSNQTTNFTSYIGQPEGVGCNASAGDIYISNTTPAYTSFEGLPTYTSGDIIGIAFDVDNQKMWWSKNGQWYSGNASSESTINISDVEAGNNAFDFSYINEQFIFPMLGTSSYASTTTSNFGQEGTFAGSTTAGGNSDSNGVGNFKYSVPSGYLALCTKNLGS